MIKLSYEELPRINQDSLQFIAGRINAIIQYAYTEKWDELRATLYNTGGLDALHCSGAMYKKNWQYKEKFSVETWIAVLNTFNMYDLDNKAALAGIVLGDRNVKFSDLWK